MRPAAEALWSAGRKTADAMLKSMSQRQSMWHVRPATARLTRIRNAVRTISASQGATPVPAARQSAQVSAANRRKDGEPEAMQNGSPFCIPVEFSSCKVRLMEVQ